MARIMALHQVDSQLASSLASSLRVVDEVVVLPHAHRSAESGAFKNVAVKLDGTEPDLDPGVFAANMFTGMSAIRVPSNVAEALLRDPARRATVLNKLATLVPSEVVSTQVQVGPDLDGDDETSKDVKEWVAGFDGPGCCVGLYAAQESRAPESGKQGMHRVHNAYYLVCKAGGGIATQTFHSRLVSALSKGNSMDDCLLSGTNPGPHALRRATIAAERNRSRILLVAAKAIGFDEVNTIGDNASADMHPHRVVIPELNVSVNTLRNADDAARSTWIYAAGCVDTAMSLGLAASSNVSEGFVAFTDANNSFKVQFRNQALDCVPFCTERLLTNRDAVMLAAKAYAEAKHATNNGGAKTDNVSRDAHPDSEWIRNRFAWVNGDSSSSNTSRREGSNCSGSDRTRSTALESVSIEPPCLWGTFDSESFITSWGRELGIADCRVVRMRPELVVITGNERAKMKAAKQYLDKVGRCGA